MPSPEYAKCNIVSLTSKDESKVGMAQCSVKPRRIVYPRHAARSNALVLSRINGTYCISRGVLKGSITTISRTECMRHVPTSDPPPISWRNQALLSFHLSTYISSTKKVTENQSRKEEIKGKPTRTLLRPSPLLSSTALLLTELA